MKTEFDDLGFLVIRNFISEKKAIKLSNEFREFCDKNKDLVSPDPQVPNASAIHNYNAFVELLSTKTSKVSKFIGERVLPSYCYARVYTKNCALDKHTDRPACEVSLTLHLDSDKKWEFCIEDKTGKVNKVVLNRGDAILYSGQDVPHWRDKYKGSFYSQVFLHYVRSAGENKFNYFEKKYGHSNHELSKYIHVFENVIPDEFCDEIIEEYGDDPNWYQTKTIGGLDTNVRNCSSIDLSLDDTIEYNIKVRKKIDDTLFDYVGQIVRKVSSAYPFTLIKQDTGYGLLRYTEGQFYTQHIDHHETVPRDVSCSIILNDDYEGGEFAFFDGVEKYKLKKGSAIVFPSNFMFPHQILPVTKGTRYSIITWLK